MSDYPDLSAVAIDRTIERIKQDTRAGFERLRRRNTLAGYPAGTVPVRDAGRQAQMLAALAAQGVQLSPTERRHAERLAALGPRVFTGGR